ncbi:MAG: DNA repair protein RadC [Akkermansiaceae bacterium]|nr:DNA repair protein RadC [Akkermansiaceae bacterium]
MNYANNPSSGELARGPRIMDLAEQLRPREKLVEHGASTLSDSELLALFIHTGIRGMSAIELSKRLIERHGSLSALGALDVGELAKEHGLGETKAARLVAVFELGVRVSRERVHTQALDSPEHIHRSFAPQLMHLPREQVMVASLDCRLRPLSIHTISIGSVNESIAHPRDILRPVISRGAHGFILVHNHPSGDPAPSRADHEVTRRVREAAQLLQLRFVDHVIIGRADAGRQAWFSFRESGHL